MVEEKKMTEQEIIARLGELYTGKGNPSNPIVLCSANFREFNREHFAECQQLQVDLFAICHRRGDRWTK